MAVKLIPRLDDSVATPMNLVLGTHELQGKYNKDLNANATVFVTQSRRCSHSRLTPLNYVWPSHHRARPDIGRKINRNIRKSYTETRKYLPSFNFLSGTQKKSQRREVGLLVLEALFQFTDYLSLEVGKFIEIGRIEAMPLAPSIKDKRMGRDDVFCLLREINRGREAHEVISYKRMLNALKDLKKAGLVKTFDVRGKNCFGKYRAAVSIKRITLKALRELGVSAQELQNARDRKKKNIIKDQLRAKELKGFKDFVQFVNDEKTRVVSTPVNVLADTARHELYSEGNLLVEIRKQYPGMSAKEMSLLYLKYRKRKKPPD